MNLFKSKEKKQNDDEEQNMVPLLSLSQQNFQQSNQDQQFQQQYQQQKQQILNNEQKQQKQPITNTQQKDNIMSNISDNRYERILNNQIMNLSIDNASLQCGNGHSYQKKAIFVSFLQYMAASFLAAGWALFFENPKIYCYQDETHSSYKECDEYTACKLNYQNNKQSNHKHSEFFINEKDNFQNLTEEYWLFCDRKEWIYFATQIFVLGGIVGSIYFGQRGEVKGRSRMLNESMGIMIMASLASYLCFDITIFIVVSFIFDFGFRGFNNSSQILLSEQCSENLRKILPSILMSGWAIGQIVISIISSYYFQWKNLQFLLMGVPLLILFFNQTTIQDSARFLIIKRRFEDAKQSLLNIAKKNNRQVDDFNLQEEVDFIKQTTREKNLLNSVYAQAQIDSYTRKSEIQHSFLSLISYHSLRSKTLVFMYIWGITTLSYYITMVEQRKYIEKDLVYHLTVAGIIELVSYLIYMNLSLTYYRKQVIKYVLASLGIGHLLFLIIPMYKIREEEEEVHHGVVQKMLNHNVIAFAVLSGLRVITAGFVNSFMFVYLVEVYPTSVRHFAFGFFTAWTKSMWILGPLISFYFDQHFPNVQPLSFIGIFLLIGVYFVRKLRETYEETGMVIKNVPDYLEEELENLK